MSAFNLCIVTKIVFAGEDALSSSFWCVEIKALLEDAFPSCLTTEEKAESYDLHKCIAKYALLVRIQELTGFELDNQVMLEIYNHPDIAFELVEADVKNLPEKTKHM